MSEYKLDCPCCNGYGIDELADKITQLIKDMKKEGKLPRCKLCEGKGWIESVET
jgi:hypothetical protein